MFKIKLPLCFIWMCIPLLAFSTTYFSRWNNRLPTSVNSTAVEENSPAQASQGASKEIVTKAVDFSKDIQPIFKASCYQCHAGEKAKAQLRLDSKADALRGGVSGKAIIPGNIKDSLLVSRILGQGDSTSMPPGKPLSAQEIALIKAWIHEGATWPDEVAAATGEKIDFAKDVQPILKDSCYQCHAGEMPKAQLRLDAKATALKGGISGPVIVPGNSKDSRLIHRVLGLGGEQRMPLKGTPLNEQQTATLRAWIDQGAPWPESASVQDAKIEKHWAFSAPTRPRTPDVKSNAWVRNPVDKFILAKIEKANLTPSPEASKETLIRRASLDLTGLPPTLEEIDRFLGDSHPDAYEKLVDSLLASPHYGERWGRWWLDAARYADTNGFEKDRPRSIWPYRDWVIKAFNDDKRFDQFTVDQLAGDLLPNPTLEQRVATGFLRNSMFNEEGAVEPEKFRVEALVDRIDTLGKTFLGLTVNCAQCHTHKFDPIKHKEYYQLYAFLNNDEEPSIDVPDEKMIAKRNEIRAAVEKIEAELTAQTPDLPRRLAEWEEKSKKDVGNWTVLEGVNAFGTVGLRFENLPDHSLIARADNNAKYTYTAKAKTKLKDITGVRLELLTDESLPRNGPGRAPSGGLFLSEFSVSAAPDGRTEAAEKVAISGATADFSRPEHPIKDAADGDSLTYWDIEAGEGTRNQDRKAVFVFKQPVGFDAGTNLTFLLSQKQDNNTNIGRFRLSVTTDSNPQVDPVPATVRQILTIPAAQRTRNQQREIFSYYRTTVPEWAAANQRIKDLLNDWPYGPTTLALTTRKWPRETHIFKRGDWLAPGDAVTPDTPAFLHPFPQGAPRSRLGLARWIVDGENPLTARVIVNRVWQQYFGAGLVATPEDFGTRSDRPSHPELLDWLALEFRDKGWSFKHLHKLIVTSATYRQSSKVTPQSLEADPTNRWLARAPRPRVDAEVIRDIALSASGLLSRKIGGPSVFPPLPPGVLDLGFAAAQFATWETSTGEDRYRRGLYTFWKRTTPYPSLLVFDAPNADVSCTRRIQSTTPLQALTTLNDQTFVEAAQSLALRVWREGGGDERAKMIYAFRLCTGRAPDSFELEKLLTLLRDQETYFKGRTAAAVYVSAPDRDKLPEDVDMHKLAPWTIVASVLLNLDETITKE